MYPTTPTTISDSTIRIFSPVVLFHDENTNSDNQIIQLKKQKVNEMLKTNGEFWSHIIWSTRNMTSPPQTPPPTFSCSSNSSMISEEEEEELNIEDDPLPAVQQRKKTTNGRKRRGNLPKNVTAILKQWLIDHCKHPYPTEEEKRGLRIKTNLTLNQISNWFINARRRILPFIVSPSSTATKKSSTTTTTTKRKRLDSE